MCRPATVLPLVVLVLADDGRTNRTLLAAGDFRSVGPPREPRAGSGWTVPVTMAEAGQENFTATLRDAGFLDEGVGDCDTETGEGRCLVTTVDGEVLMRASIAPSLADTVRDGEFEGQFVFSVRNESRAERLSTYLRTGELPSSLSVTAVEPVTASSGGDDASSAVGPGFGPGTAALAVVAAALAAMRLR